MPSLLTPQKIAKIRADIKNVTDTFCATNVTYRLAKTKLDRYGEGQNNGTSVTFEDKIMPCMVTYGSEEIERSVKGAASFRSVKLMFNADVWQTESLYVNGEIKASETKDYVLVSGRTYKVTNIAPTGAFETNNFLIIVIADLQPQKTI